MIGQLLEGNFFQNYGVLIILIVFLVFMLVFSATRRKKDAKMAEDFANNLKVGDKVKTNNAKLEKCKKETHFNQGHAKW